MDMFISYNGKLIIVSEKRIESDKPAVYASVYEFFNENQCWKSAGTLQIGDTSAVELVHFAVVVEFATGFNIPVFLLKSKKVNAFEIPFYLVAIKSNCQEIVPLKKLKLHVEGNIEKEFIYITDGPTIVWYDNLSLFLGIQEKKNPCTLIQCLLLRNFNLKKILWIYRLKNLLILLGYVQHVEGDNKDSDSAVRAFFIVADLTDGDHDDIRSAELDISSFFPSDYINLSLISVQKCSLEPYKDLDDIRLQTELYAVTNEGYILKFRNGILVSAIQNLVEEDISNAYNYLQLDVLKPFSLDEEIVVLKKKQLVSAIKEKDNKIECSWNGIRQILVDDFVRCGSSQLLLLTGDFDGSWNVGWILTDLGVWHIDCKDGLNNTQAYQKEECSHNTAVDALRSRLQNDLVLLEEKKRNVSKRSQYLVETWQRLHQMNSDLIMKSGTNKHTLVNLVGCSSIDNKRFDVSWTQEDSARASVHITGIWQRIFNGKWIVGVDIINKSNRCMRNPVLSLLPKLESISLLQIDMLTTVKHHRYLQKDKSRLNASPSSNPSKRRKLESDPLPESLQELLPLSHGPVIASCNVPKFGQLSSFSCHCLLNWDEKMDNPDTASIGEEFKCNIDCIGEVCLNLKDVLSSKHSLDFDTVGKNNHEENFEENRKNLQALNAVQIPTRLQIKSIHSVLKNIPKWLKDKMGFQYIAKYMCYVATQVRPLSSVRVIPDPTPGVRKSSLTLYTSNKEEVCLFVQHLYSCLPDDIVVLQDTSFNLPVLYKNASLCINEEIDFVTSNIKDLTEEDNFVLSITSSDSKLDEKGNIDVEKIRQNYSRNKAHVLNRNDQTVDLKELEKFKHGNMKRQENTDKAFVEITK